MGFWSSLGSAISSAVSGAVSVVSSAVKAIGSVVVEGAKKFLEFEMGKLETIVTILETIAKALGIIKPEEDTEELGDKAMKAEKKPEDFDSTNDYIEYLRNEIRSSKEELEALPKEQRLARTAIGSALLSKAISEKKDIAIPVEFWNEAVNMGLDAQQIDTFLKKFQDAGVAPSEFLKYLKRELNEEKESKMDGILEQTYKELEPSMSEEEIEKKLLQLQGL